MKKLKHLIIAAYHNELKSLCRLGKKKYIIKDTVAFLSAGIGPVIAASGLTRFLCEHRPKLIISLGTAGVVNTKKLKTGQIVMVKCVSTCSGFAETYNPLSQKTIQLNTTGSIKNQIKKIKKTKEVSVYCPQEISKSNNYRLKLLKEGFEAENLEAYAFAFVAQQFKIPLISFLGLSNTVGPKGHQEWLANEKSICRQLGNLVKLITMPS